MVSKASTVLLLGANLLIPIAILTFASGFFPYKPFLSGLAQYDTLKYGPPPNAPFDKVVFMVVDALRRWDDSSFGHYEALILAATSYIANFPGLISLKGMRMISERVE